MDGGGIHFGESKCSLRTGQEPLRGVREQCSLGTGPNNKTPKECGAKLITVGAGMPTVYWAEAQIRSMSTVLRDMWREPILGARQLKYECSLSEGTTPAKSEAMVVEDGAEAPLDVEETC